MEFPIWKKIFKKHDFNQKDIFFFLKETAIFGNQKNRILRELSKLVHIRKFHQEEIIFNQNDLGAGFYMIYSGKVKIITSREGLTLTLAVLDKYSFFGELSLFGEQRRNATAMATEETILLGFFQPDLLDIIETKPKIGVEILMSLTNIIVERLQRTNQLLENAYFKGKMKHES